MFTRQKLAVLTVSIASATLLFAHSANAAMAHFQTTDGTDLGDLDCARLDYQNPHNNFVDTSIDANLWAIDPSFAAALLDGCSQAQAQEAAGNGGTYNVTLQFSEPVGPTPVPFTSPSPSVSPSPSATTTPSSTPLPSSTPSPSATPTPSSTPSPTATPSVTPVPGSGSTPQVLDAATQALPATLPKTGSDSLGLMLGSAILAALVAYLRVRRA